MSKKSDQRENVVIVGGGFLGTLVARQLCDKLDASKYHLILINDRPFFINLVAAARMTVVDIDNLDERALVPFDKLFIDGKGTFKLGQVVAIEEKAPGKGGSVVLEDGENVPYASLILATGQSWPGAINFPTGESILEHSKAWRKKFADAQDIVLVGGGAVGIETAGELRDTYPTKKITIVQGGSMLLNSTYPSKFRKDVERRVRKRDINVVLGEMVDQIPEEGAIGLKTRSGKEFPTADFVVPVFGPRPNTAFISTLGSDVLASNGFIKVKPTLELQSHPGVFAVGDVLDWKEQKQAGKAGWHLAVAVPNILSFLAHKPQAKHYKGSWEMIVIPIGRDHGAGYFDVLWGIMLGDWFCRLVKGQELFVGKARADRGY